MESGWGHSEGCGTFQVGKQRVKMWGGVDSGMGRRGTTDDNARLCHMLQGRREVAM